MNSQLQRMYTPHRMSVMLAQVIAACKCLSSRDNLLRVQVLYIFMQQYVDRLVAEHIDSSRRPADWFQDVATVKARASTRDFLPGAAQSKAKAAEEGPAGGSARPVDSAKLSPMAAVLSSLDTLINPPEQVSPLSLEFVKTGKGGAARDATVEFLQALAAVAVQGMARDGNAAGNRDTIGARTVQDAAAASTNGVGSSNPASGADGASAGAPLPPSPALPLSALPFTLVDVPLLTPEQSSALESYLRHDTPLQQWPAPRLGAAGGASGLSIKQHLAMDTHRAIFGPPADGAPSFAAMQRPPLKGRYAAKVRHAYCTVVTENCAYFSTKHSRQHEYPTYLGIDWKMRGASSLPLAALLHGYSSDS